MPQNRGVESVERALRLLECFSGAESALSLAELSRRSGHYKSTILRLAVSLDRFGYMHRGADGRYRLGPTLWRLGAAYRRGFDAADAIRPELAWLVEETGETASFYVRDGDSRVCVYRREPRRAIRFAVSEGARLPLATGATGRVLLAWSQDDEQFASVRADGFTRSRGERDNEVAAIAVPVHDMAGAFRGALSISGPITRLDELRSTAALGALQASAGRIRLPALD